MRDDNSTSIDKPVYVSPTIDLDQLEKETCESRDRVLDLNQATLIITTLGVLSVDPIVSSGIYLEGIFQPKDLLY